MIPTLFGIILITFFLFNVAGGDPGRSKLGKQASAELLEQFDLVRGYDKPLFCGLWGRTRAYEDLDFAVSPGPWKRVPGAVCSNASATVYLAPGTNYAIPLGFALQPDTRYRWRLTYRLPRAGEAAAALRIGPRDGADLRKNVLVADGRTHRAIVDFATPADTRSLACRLDVQGSPLELAAVQLRRRAAGFFDSQLTFYLNQLAHLDFGVSIETNQRVAVMMRDGILPSLSLMIPMFLVGLVASISLALVCAFFRNTAIDRFFVVFSVVLMSVNYLVWIVLGQFALGYTLRWFPVWGYESARYLVLPCLIGILSGLGAELRFYRTVMLDEVYRDYVRTAFAKGVGQSGVLFKHVLKNAMIPILTGVIMEIPFLYTGSLLLETFFGIPGLGRMGIQGLNSSDVDVIRALVFVGAVIYVIANLITDLCYALVDPRVKLK